MWNRIRLFLNPFDARWEDMNRDNWLKVAIRDTSAGLVVAMMAIPMAMGFAMASGLRPEHGILAGAIAGLIGALFSGSKYNVYGPVAALIPMIAGVMAAYRTESDPYAGHGFLVLICVCSGAILVFMGLLGWGRFGNLVPHSVVVGFSIGIAVTIGVTQCGEVLGFKDAVSGNLFTKMRTIAENIGLTNRDAVIIGVLTFAIIHMLLKISIYIPAPMIALAACTVLSTTVFANSGLSLVKTKYGSIPTDFLSLTPPTMPGWDAKTVTDLIVYSLAFAFVCGFESILSARMADRLAENKGTPYNPDKEFFGQGLNQIFAPLLNGMPMSGALARTATNIKVGAVTPLSSAMICVMKLGLTYFMARYLELVPMACIGGILMWVAYNMVKPKEIREIVQHSKPHTLLMVYTALMVTFAGFLTGVLSAMVIYGIFYKQFREPEEVHETLVLETESSNAA